MGGLYTSLQVAREEHCTGCLVLSCDVPLLVPGLLTRLVEHREQHPEALVTALQDARGWLHPLIALWSVEAIAFLEQAMTSGDYSLRRAVPAEHWQAVACTPREELSLANANTPQEWQHICALLEQGLPAKDRARSLTWSCLRAQGGVSRIRLQDRSVREVPSDHPLPGRRDEASPSGEGQQDAFPQSWKKS